jgi:hypothetical protein
MVSCTLAPELLPEDPPLLEVLLPDELAPEEPPLAVSPPPPHAASSRTNTIREAICSAFMGPQVWSRRVSGAGVQDTRPANASQLSAIANRMVDRSLHL